MAGMWGGELVTSGVRASFAKHQSAAGMCHPTSHWQTPVSSGRGPRTQTRTEIWEVRGRRSDLEHVAHRMDYCALDKVAGKAASDGTGNRRSQTL